MTGKIQRAICALMIVLSAASLAAVPAAAEEKNDKLLVKEGFVYDPKLDAKYSNTMTVCVNEDGNLEIVKYSGWAEDVEIPATVHGMDVVGIQENAFADIGAKTIKLPDTIEYIAANAFLNCVNLTEVVFGSNLKTVGYRLFNNCPELKSVVFPESLEKIEGRCFYNCPALESVYVPGTTDASAGLAKHEQCPNLTVITVKGSSAARVAGYDDFTVEYVEGEQSSDSK